jgi:hypothetical protein
MNIPKLDKRTKEYIENRICELAASYTPEWKFSPAAPDMAGVAAKLYADMLMEAVDKYNRTPEKNMVEFFSGLGTEPLYAKPAQGYVVFDLSGNEDNVKGVRVDKNSVLTTVGDGKTTNTYTTASGLYVVNSRITDIFTSDVENDAIYMLYADSQEENRNGAYVNHTHQEGNKNIQRHRLLFSGEACAGLDENAEVLLTISPDLKAVGQERALLEEIEKQGIYYSTQTGYAKCGKVRCVGNVLHLSFQPDAAPAKKEIHGIYNYWFSISLHDVSKLDNIYIQDIRMGSKGEKLPVKSICNEIGELTADYFRPFDRNPIPYTSVYFVMDSVLCRKGADVHLEFRLDYEKSPAKDEEDSQEIEWKNIMKKNKLKKPKEYDISIKMVVWEYFNGSGWVRLFDDNRYQEVFNGDNGGQIIKLDFSCPDNIEKVFLSVGESYAIRARITAVENYMRLAANYIVPIVSNPVFSYAYKMLPQVETLLTENNLEEKIYDMKENRYSFRPLYREKKEGNSLYFAFSSPPDMPHINILFLPEKSEYSENSGYVWEYYGKNGWQSLYCRDETMGLTRTGVLSLDARHDFRSMEKFRKQAYWIRLRYPNRKGLPVKGSFKIWLNAVMVQNLAYKDAEYFSVSDENGYECRLGFGNVYKACVMVNEIQNISGVTATEMIQEKKALPVYGDNGELTELWVRWNEDDGSGTGRIYYLNRDNSTVVFGVGHGQLPPQAQGENIKITYVTCSGEKGNLSAGKSFTMENNGGYFVDIMNPTDIYGGSNKEIIGKTLERASGMLRMHGRLCTENDYELAAKYFDRNILKVKCMGNKNMAGEKAYGAVTLVILLKNREYFPEISQSLRKHILKLNSCSVKPELFYITEPDFVYYYINLTVRGDDKESYSEKKQRINANITQYFNLSWGGEKHNGWDIGQVPEKMAIYNILSDFDDIDEITYFNITVFDRNGNELTEGEIAEKKELGRMIPVLGGTEISIHRN